MRMTILLLLTGGIIAGTIGAIASFIDTRLLRFAFIFAAFYIVFCLEMMITKKCLGQTKTDHKNTNKDIR
jgi:uncharacterized membrane protein YfcA